MYAFLLTAIGGIFLTLFLIFRDKKSSTTAIVLKTITSIFFIATALVAMRENPWGCRGRFLTIHSFIIMGLVLGLIGDIVLDFKIYFQGLEDKYPKAKRDSEKMTYLGMSVFGVGHVLYITACTLRFIDDKINLIWVALGSVGFTAIVFLVSIYLLKMRFGKYMFFAIAYSLLLCFFVGVSTLSIYDDGPRRATILLLVGSVLFLLSDLVLSITYFSKAELYKQPGPLNPESRVMISVNHALYYAAQFCIALSLMYI